MFYNYLIMISFIAFYHLTIHLYRTSNTTENFIYSFNVYFMFSYLLYYSGYFKYSCPFSLLPSLWARCFII